MLLLCRTVSCPGKVLATGGYLVLSPEHVGLVLAVNARFQVTVQGVLSGDPESNQEISPRTEILPQITVSSPQFMDGLWVFEWRDGALECVVPLSVYLLSSISLKLLLVTQAASQYIAKNAR